MIRRFQIEDLIVQDANGVTFRAVDNETGNPIALRRFFPFGADGGGLHEDEQTAYNIALARLAGLRHPSMRAVVSGGCDPVDGIPYIATEWIEGNPLHEIVAESPLPAETAARLVTQALEVCELLSHVLAEESVWVETELPTIIVGSPGSGREFTFWISPLKWLGGGEHRGLQSIVTLTEQAMGWHGQIVNDQAGRGLGGWLNWLRAAASTTTLQEARESLAASIGVEPPPPAKSLVAAATQPTAVRPLKQPSSKGPFIVMSIVGLLAIGAGAGLWWQHKRNHTTPEVAAATVNDKPVAKKSTAPKARPSAGQKSPVSESATIASDQPPADSDSELASVNRRAAELSAQAGDANRREMQAEEREKNTLAEQKASVEANGGIYSPEFVGLLLEQADHGEVTVEGELRKFDASGSGGWLYLVFSDNPLSARGKIVKSETGPDLTQDSLKDLIGKKLRIKGAVERQSLRRDKRPLIVIKDRASIQVQP